MTEPVAWLSALRWGVELLATAAFALSGVLAAARRRLDAVGVCVVACLTAFGGGTLRDLLLDRRPFFWVRQVEALWGVLALCALAILLMRRHHRAPTARAIQWPDAVGLGLFTASGVEVALQAGMTGLVAALMGVITGTFGGVLRDVVCNEVPALLSDHRPYAICALAGAAVQLLALQAGAADWVALLAALVVTTGSRALALVRGWTVPEWRA